MMIRYDDECGKYIRREPNNTSIIIICMCIRDHATLSSHYLSALYNLCNRSCTLDPFMCQGLAISNNLRNLNDSLRRLRTTIKGKKLSAS